MAKMTIDFETINFASFAEFLKQMNDDSPEGNEWMQKVKLLPIGLLKTMLKGMSFDMFYNVVVPVLRHFIPTVLPKLSDVSEENIGIEISDIEILRDEDSDDIRLAVEAKEIDFEKIAVKLLPKIRESLGEKSIDQSEFLKELISVILNIPDENMFRMLQAMPENTKNQLLELLFSEYSPMIAQFISNYAKTKGIEFKISNLTLNLSDFVDKYYA